MTMPSNILVAGDAPAGIDIAKCLPANEFKLTEISDCKEAYTFLQRKHRTVALMLLISRADGQEAYDLLEKVKRSAAISPLPVIMISEGNETEKMALTLGANDFVKTPYSPALLILRVRNMIRFRETASAVNDRQTDELTGLLNRSGFFEKAAELIRNQPEGYYVLSSVNVDNFKVVNSQYGNEKGDDVLRRIAAVIKTGFETVGGICGRIMADSFALLYPRSFISSALTERVRRYAVELDGSVLPVSYRVGRFFVDNASLPVSEMYDRAVLAESSVKGRSDVSAAVFDESMLDKLTRSREILSGVRAALEERLFEVWLQPQYDHAAGVLKGSEALVRWRHPEKGLIPPGEFLPVFESSGYLTEIYELDKFVWERTCSLLRKWLDEERVVLPVSVNISQYDIRRSNLTDTITGIVRKYGIPPELLRLEISAAAFSSHTEAVSRAVQKLMANGCTIVIDNYGSANSSLNVLKDVRAQTLKLDMLLMECGSNHQRGEEIIRAVVGLAKRLNMTVTAGGVETKAQADFLTSAGCDCIQGFYYARPMSVGRFEALMTPRA